MISGLTIAVTVVAAGIDDIPGIGCCHQPFFPPIGECVSFSFDNETKIIGVALPRAFFHTLLFPDLNSRSGPALICCYPFCASKASLSFFLALYNRFLTVSMVVPVSSAMSSLLLHATTDKYNTVCCSSGNDFSAV